MRLWSLLEVLLLCLCAAHYVAAGGQTVAMRRTHQLVRRGDHAKREQLGQALARRDSSLDSKVCRIVSPRASAAPPSPQLAPRSKFCRPKTVSASNNSTGATKQNSKSSAENFPPGRGKWLGNLTPLVVVLLLYS